MSDTANGKDMICVRCFKCETAIYAPMGSFDGPEECPNCKCKFADEWVGIYKTINNFYAALDALITDEHGYYSRIISIVPGEKLGRLLNKFQSR